MQNVLPIRVRILVPMELTSHNLVETAEVDGVGKRRRHRLLPTVHRHLGEEAGRSHGCCLVLLLVGNWWFAITYALALVGWLGLIYELEDE